MKRRSPYPAVNERRRKREWNNRSTAQLRRRRDERAKDAAWRLDPENPHHRRARHGLVNTGYMAALMADREEILAEARREATLREVLVRPSYRAEGHTRSRPRRRP